METQRSKALKKYIKENKGQLVKNQSMFIAYGGKLHTHELYRIPIDYLFHNIRNGRFRSELLEKEEELKRKLDPTKENDAVEIRKLLLDQDKLQTEILKKDIIKNGQLEPGIITFDGAVINANRRLAIMHDLYKETRIVDYKYLMVGILPEGVEEVDLWRIEAGLQFGRDFRLQYGGVNELLKLREGEKQDLSDKDISVALLGRYSEKQVRAKLDTLNLIDSYLDFIGKNGEYHLITEDRDLEKFNSLYNNVISPLKNKSTKKKKEIAELTTIAFSLINKTNLTHWNIRELRDIATNNKAEAELRAPFEKGIPTSSKEIKATSDKLKEGFVSAKEIIENADEGVKPERLLKRAKSALEGVDENSSKLKEKEVTKLLNDVKKRIDVLIAASK
jgi:hypothetical protein